VLDNEFYVVAAVLTAAVVVAAMAVKLRQPLIVSFLAVGVLVGPAAFGWVSADDEIVIFAELGIAVLLFLVGLKLDIHLIRTTGPVALATGLGQVAFTSAVGFALALLLGLAPVTALYVAVALTFSSTIIIVKLLSDKREIDQLHGRIAVGFLIVQDIVVVLVMIGLSAFGAAGGTGSLAGDLGLVAVKGVAFLGGVVLLMRYVVPQVLEYLTRSKELLVLAAVAWAVALASLGDWLGFSKEVGAFLGGISLASTPYREAIAARLVSLRDFLLLFFFIDLGARLEIADAAAQLPAALVLSLFVLIGNPIIVLVIMGFMGYRKRTGFLAGLTVAQISEFSLILAALGLSLGHIGQETVGLITAVGVITITVSTYMILYSHSLYARLRGPLSVFERTRLRQLPPEAGEEIDVVVFGAGRYGSRLVQELLAAEQRVLVVDEDPHALARMDELGVATLFGDAEEPEFAAALPLNSASWVLSTIPSRDLNLALLSGLREAGFSGQVAATSHLDLDTERLEQAGVDLVLRPYHAAAESSAAVLLDQPSADPGTASPHRSRG
jgi:Kef-type K+ transport system membrane component KefB